MAFQAREKANSRKLISIYFHAKREKDICDKASPNLIFFYHNKLGLHGLIFFRTLDR
jgi:hypothetical protein